MNGMEIRFCGELLAAVGEELVHDFRVGVRTRQMADMVQRFNEVNASASNKIEKALSAKFPNIQWLDAEFNTGNINGLEDIQKGDYWLCDPLDGALNFLQGVPYWSLSLCLIHNGRPQLSFVYDPCCKEMFHACRDQGTFLNGNQINVSDTVHISDAILATAHPTLIRDHKEDTMRTAKEVCRILPKTQAVRMMGAVSLQLAHVASGGFDGYWEHGFDMYDWWAGALLVEEAGGIVTDTSGNPFTWGSSGIIATTPALATQLKSELHLDDE